jgi:hypothetical protein
MPGVCVSWFMLIANQRSIVPGCKFFVTAGSHHNESDGIFHPSSKVSLTTGNLIP